MSENSEGSAYLASLKRSSHPDSGAAAAPARSENAGSFAGMRPLGMEKRRGPRYKCNGSAEISEQDANVRTWATCNDISMHGCYLEAPTTYPVGTVLHMKIEANNIKIVTQGNVRVTYPHLGMGIAFTYMSEEDRTRVRELLRTLGTPSVIMGSSSARTVEPIPAVSNHKAALAAVINFFEDRQMLSRPEFLRLLRESQGSASGKE